MDILKSKFSFIIVICLLTGYLIPVIAVRIPDGYEVAKWYGFKSAAISYTFDDNTPKQLTAALPIFDQNNFKATFYTITNWKPDWPVLLSASLNGHEVGSHTLSHLRLNTIDTAAQKDQIFSSQQIINSHITNTSCLTIAYPYCLIGDYSLLGDYYIAGRICNEEIISGTPEDFFRIGCFVAGSEGKIKTAEDFNNTINLAKNNLGWCVFLIHGIDDDGGWSPLKSSELDSHLAYVKNNDTIYWVETFLNIVKYIRERDAVTLTETKIKSNSLYLEITDTLDNKIYDYPVTIKRIIPEGWKNVQVYHENEIVNSICYTEEGARYVMFDVIPDRGEVVLTNSKDK